MREEKYKAKCPGHILMADPAYFEGDGKNPEEYERMEYQMPPGYKMGILLSKKWDIGICQQALIYDGPLFCPGAISGQVHGFGDRGMLQLCPVLHRD